MTEIKTDEGKKSAEVIKAFNAAGIGCLPVPYFTQAQYDELVALMNKNMNQRIDSLGGAEAIIDKMLKREDK